MIVDDFLSHSKIAFVLFLVIVYFIRRKSGDYIVNHGLMECFIILFFVVLGSSYLWKGRYDTAQFVSNGITGSIVGDPVVLQDEDNVKWALFNLGEIFKPFHIRGKLASVIVPYAHVNNSGASRVCKTFTQPVNFKSIPSVVYRYMSMRETDFNTENVWYGVYSAEFVHKDPKSPNYLKQIDNLRIGINEREDIINDKFDLMVTGKKFADELEGKQPWYKFLKRNKSADEEE